MAINFLNTSSEGGKPWVRWGARACQWEMSAEGGSESFEFKAAIIDMENIKVGWGKLAKGQAPEWVWGESIDKPIERPAGTYTNEKGKEVSSWSQACSVEMYSESMFGDDRATRSFQATQKGSLAAINELHTQYEDQKSKNSGKVPVVSFSGHEFVGEANYGTNVPKLDIVKWVKRPEGFSSADSQTTPEPTAESEKEKAPSNEF